MITYGRQSIDQSDIDAVVEVLKGDWLTQGPAVETFEFDLKNYFGADHACAVTNGTAALHLTGLTLELQPGDIVTTGTPPGVGMGRKPPLYLKPGDEMHLSIDQLGEQHQKVK